ncbi:hypothetical protein [Microbacterium lacticum]|uniref:hypothetical protein n=1 Tax=Microbacterium lacticum TaxID=33885 RepID=UPI003A8841EB
MRDLAAAVDDVGLEHGAHARPVGGERGVPEFAQRRDHAAYGGARIAREHGGDAAVHRLEVAQEGRGADAGERREFVVEAGERGGGARVQEVGRPQPVVDQGVERGVVECGACGLRLPQPRQLQRLPGRVAHGPQRQAELAQGRQAEAHVADIRLAQHVAQHEA